MLNENNQVITYQGKSITLLSGDQEDYVNLTEMAKAFGQLDSIRSWMRDQTTRRFLIAWEEKYNLMFKGVQLDTFILSASKRDELSIKYFIEKTNAIGIRTISGGAQGGTYAHQDIALRFAAYLSPEFELFLISELRRLRRLEQKRESNQLLNHEEILALVRLKEVFKYVAHQEIIETTHKEVFAAQSGSENPYAEFYRWRNKVLDIDKAQVDERIKKYCLKNNIPLIKGKNKREKIIAMDCYESVRIAVWDFLEIKGEVNALTLAGLVKDMIKTEKGTIKRTNDSNLFEPKQDLGEFTDFESAIAKIPVVNAAKSTLRIRAQVGDRTKKLGR
jgi:hypothetical protein